jgi:hypothetical protein
MLAELREPLLNVVEGLRFCDIIHEERPYSVPVVRVRNGSVPFLASGVPNLCTDLLILHLNVPCGEFHSYGRL